MSQSRRSSRKDRASAASGLRHTRLLWPLVPAYAMVLAAKQLALQQGWLRTLALRSPVISIGNLSVGGSGKTPLVLRLAHLLAERGYAVDVLSRGYGRSGAGVEQVLPQAALAAARFGDEPVLIARSAPAVPVFVGRDRHAAGLLAEAQLAAPRLHLLDDGFQHRRLRRAVDIVVLHPGDLRESLLPAGRLREPPSALRRASFAVVREDDDAGEEAVHRHAPGLPVWRMRRNTVVPTAAFGGPAVAFCGIAHPEAFFNSLREQGVALAACRAFADHHRWTEQEMRRLAALARAHDACTLLTTEKDLVRLSDDQRQVLKQACPLHAVPLETTLLDEEACMEQLLALLPERARERAV